MTNDRQIKHCAKRVVLESGPTDHAVWPSCSPEWADLAWRMRYSNDSLDKKDLLNAASLIDAYLELFEKPTKARTELLKRIKKATKDRN